MAGDLDSIAEAARDLGYRQVDAQFQSSDNFDSKSLGVLAFDGALLAVVLAGENQGLFYQLSWLIPVVLTFLSAVFALVAIQVARFADGPDPRVFYDSVSRGTAAAANVELISQFGGPHGVIARNDRRLRRKIGGFTLALWIAVLAAVIGGILFAIAR